MKTNEMNGKRVPCGLDDVELQSSRNAYRRSSNGRRPISGEYLTTRSELIILEY